MRDAAVQARVAELTREIDRIRREAGPWRMAPEVGQQLQRLERRKAMLLEHERTEGRRHA